MGQYSKAWAAGIAGAIMTIAAWALEHYGETPLPVEVVGAAQALITTALVYFAPANDPA